MRPDPFIEQLIAAMLQVRAAGRAGNGMSARRALSTTASE
jgi:hypothetical protein